MYKRKNKPERHSRARFRSDPLFEQVPKDKNGRRKLSDLDDEKLIEIANTLMQREKITKIKALNEIDSTLLLEIRKRKKTRELKVYVEKDTISQMKEIPIIRKARISKRVEKILETLPEEPPKHPSGRINWSSLSEDQIFAFAWRLCKKGEVKTVTQLLEYNKELYNILTRLELIKDLPLENPPKERNEWEGVENAQVIETVNTVIRRRGIEKIGELAALEPALYGICQKRGIVRNLELRFVRSPKKANKKTTTESIA
jgi:hypothetical protein